MKAKIELPDGTMVEIEENKVLISKEAEVLYSTPASDIVAALDDSGTHTEPPPPPGHS